MIVVIGSIGMGVTTSAAAIVNGGSQALVLADQVSEDGGIIDGC